MFLNALIFFCLFVNFSRFALTAVMSLVCFFVFLGSFLFFLGFEYLGLLFLAIYSGAVSVLFVFVVMLLGVKFKQAKQFTAFQLIFINSLLFFTNWHLSSLGSSFCVQPPFMGSLYLLPVEGMSRLGVVFFNTHFHLLILIGLLLLLVTVGVSVVLLRCL
jgi:NADH:ubiquinone oxidoreductase subunit 6 (subunit J)